MIGALTSSDQIYLNSKQTKNEEVEEPKKIIVYLGFPITNRHKVLNEEGISLESIYRSMMSLVSYKIESESWHITRAKTYRKDVGNFL